jgi:hypothetical protein
MLINRYAVAGDGWALAVSVKTGSSSSNAGVVCAGTYGRVVLVLVGYLRLLLVVAGRVPVERLLETDASARVAAMGPWQTHRYRSKFAV